MADTTAAPTPTAPTPDAAPVQTYTTQTRTDGNGQPYQVRIPDQMPPANSPTTPPANSSPATIVTSGQSRANYANNVNTLNGATSNIRTVQSGQNASTIAASLGMTPAQFLALNPSFAATGHSGDYQGLSGLIQPGQTYKIGPDGTPTQVPNGPSADGTTGTGGAAGDGSTGTGGDSSSSSTTTNTTGLDPAIKSQYDSAVANLDQNITDAKSTLDQARATLANDPAATAAVDAISAKYDQLITQMKNKNAILLGGYKTNAARSGSLQFANDMNSNFMSEEMDAASGRVSTLVAQEQSLILKAQQAYKTGDLKALNDATTAYEKANTDKISALDKLLKATNDQVKTVQAQQKIDQVTAKNGVANDAKLSSGIAESLAGKIKAAGITDPAQIDQYIQQAATNAGISNVDVLRSALTKAQQSDSKFSLGQANTQSIINKRGQTGTGKSKSTNAQKDTIANITARFGTAPIRGADHQCVQPVDNKIS
jgi:hypothetical protein